MSGPVIGDVAPSLDAVDLNPLLGEALLGNQNIVLIPPSPYGDHRWMSKKQQGIVDSPVSSLGDQHSLKLQCSLVANEIEV